MRVQGKRFSLGRKLLPTNARRETQEIQYLRKDERGMRKSPRKDDRGKEKGDCQAQKEGKGSRKNGIKAGVTKTVTP